MMHIGSLFAGIGGLELGLERAGLGRVVWQCEIDPYCRAVLADHWPYAVRYVDVQELEGRSVETIDLLCGGFPCQDVSAAGKGAGLKGKRSGLWAHFARLVQECAPDIVVVENVASAKRRWLPAVRRDLHMLGYRSTAYALSAADVGAPHLRRRIFVVAYAERVQLREQPWGGGGSRRQGEAFAGVTREKRRTQSMGDADIARRSRCAEESDARRQIASDGGWWAVEPRVGRVAHGLPGGLVGRRRRARLRALGNAVVPQCAETIGNVILQTLEEERDGQGRRPRGSA